ncbi:HEAT repeat domain-containing protein [bacterium]|nr:HEAT repeat domain-containing protein [bacterium]
MKNNKINFSRILGLILLFIGLSINPFASSDNSKEGKEIRPILNQKYNKWQEHCVEVQFSSNPNDYIDEYFKEIVDLGTPILVYIIEMMKEKSIHHGPIGLGTAFERITKCDLSIIKDVKQADKDEYFLIRFPDLRVSSEKELYLLYERWLENGREKIPEYYYDLYSKWLIYYDQNDNEKLKEISVKIATLGLDVIPLMIDDLENGNHEIIEIISDLTNEGLNNDILERGSAIDWWRDNRQRFVINNSRVLEIIKTENDVERAKKWIELLESGEDIYKENAEIGLSNLPGHKKVVDYLFIQMMTKSERVRSSVAAAMGKIIYKHEGLKEKTKQRLIHLLKENNPEVKREIIYALGEIGGKDVIPHLKKVKKSDNTKKTIKIYTNQKKIEKTIYPVKREAERAIEKIKRKRK